MTDEIMSAVSVSIVSHGQGCLVTELLQDLVDCPEVAEILVTKNVPEPDIPIPETMQQRVRFIHNDHPKGFGANHNQAFWQCSSPFFAVLNPDVRLQNNPFPLLLSLIADTGCALVVPSVVNPEGQLEDSVRYFPTLMSLVAKLFHLSDGRYLSVGKVPLPIDWAAGMFMLFQTDVFRNIGGFDEGFFLYYEDVDICARLRKSGERVMLHPVVSVIHSAQRASRHSLRYMVWHLASMIRYFVKHLGRLPSGSLSK